MLFDTIVLWENAWLSATQSMRQHLCDAMGLSNLCYTYDDELVKFLAVENRPRVDCPDAEKSSAGECAWAVLSSMMSLS